MMKQAKKFIAIMLTFVFVLSLVPLGALAEEVELTPVELAMEDYTYTRYNNATNKAVTYYKTAHQYGYIMASSQYTGYTHINLSGYEEILKNPGTTVRMKLNPRYDASNLAGKPGINDLKGVLAPANCDDIDLSTMSWNIANTAGFHTTTRPTLFVKSDGINNGSSATYVDADLANLNSVLDEDYDDSTVSVWFTRIKGDTVLYASSSKLIISYNPDITDNKAYLNDIDEEFSFDNIFTRDGEKYVTSSAQLPLKYKGADITWTSSDTETINPETGIITQSVGEDKEVTLTAKLSYKDYLGDEETSDNIREVDVTVLSEELKSVVIPLSDNTYITSGAPSMAAGVYSNCSYSRYMYPAGNGLYPDGNDRMVFLKYDFSKYYKYLFAARSISMNITTAGSYPLAGGNSLLSVLPDGYESWTTADLSYDSAVEGGLYTAPAIYTYACSASGQKCEITSSGEVLNAIRKSISDNPDDGMVNFRWEAAGQSVVSYRLPGNEPKYLSITLYYYESELSDDDSFVNSKISSMPWSYVSQQEQNKVITDIALPATFYGAAVTWSSNNEDVVTSLGEVIPSDVDTTVTLTATVNGLTKAFDVTVPASTDYTLDSSKGNYVNAYVWAKEPCDSCVLIVATYVDDTLVGIDVKDTDFTLEKGKNFIWTKLSGKGSGKTVKVMLVNDMESLTPLAVAK